ncbi:flagellar basal-body MS-ring/collar protein FliF [Edwardsiella anguillarum]|uniref:Flagellar M-ring protein n=1 Tax=Edwardsiella anguillarum ET080813 TaxID=667120 RepID=A0A076LI75_9GAMM|nr:flagellar basal-body MS-ring/collar protein FliF [Edwardsiella anguillarum]AKM47560.1 flagellar M-ring protein FliF [Edwardsiella sp. EA181011]GAJ66266.1 flagellar M-ring protein FliF [Edwardsiella piscicida]AIJ06612.1 Flagellar M-ring protein FliF [Edwardsiella anguillarum ET080813]KAB0593249.1 flagellar basal body M-ring protein FliF [Edwardsiella anguillarum]RFT04391.1 flagellar M-ring protein FliF [Edwardsiella anguillarum]
MNASATGTAGTAAKSAENSIKAILERVRANPKIPLLLASAVAIAIVVVLALWARAPDYRVLYSNISDRDGGAIVTQLTQMNIPYRFANNGTTLMVPADKVYDTRLKLAQQGLPKGGAVGFELLDQEKFGISQFSEQINYQRALEGELARTIETLGPVVSARVHLAMPKPSLFVREQKQPSASVTLTLEPGRALDDGQINAIVYMVSSSVAGLPPGNVTVVDQFGHLLTQPDGTGRDLNAAQLKFTSEVEGRLQRRIETILQPMLGSGNVHAQVTAQLDFASREQTDEEYKPNQLPNQAAIRSQQISQSDQSGGQLNGGVPGALSNEPAPPATGNIDKPRSAQGTAGRNAPTPSRSSAISNNGRLTSRNENIRRDETTNYEVDRTIRHTQERAGNIERLSVAVVVNYATDTKGKEIALSQEKMDQINNLVREAMGFSQSRGDTLSVVNTPFNSVEDNGGELPFWQKQSFIDLLTTLGRYLLVALVAWLLWRKLVKPMLTKQQLAAAAAQQRVDAPPLSVQPAKQPSNEELQQRRKLQQRSTAEAQTERVREMAEQDPRVVALVIRQWMSTEQQ